MKKLVIISSLICLVLLTGCDEIVEVEVKEVGTFVGVTPIVTSFNESVKSIVTTTGGVFTIFGSSSGVVGEPVVLRNFSNRTGWYLYIGDSKRGRQIIGY